MAEPSRRSSRLALVGGLGAALLCAGLGFTLGRSTGSTSPAPVRSPAPQVQVPPQATGTANTAPSVLLRADLIEAVRAAIDRMSGDEEAAPRMRELAGRRFVLRLPFGCGGATEDARIPLRWHYDEKSGTLRVSATPIEWTPADWVESEVVATVQRIEGFWVSRPWTSSEACPQPPAPAQPDILEPSDETVGLAMFVSGTASRVGRQPGEAFASVKKIAQSDIDTSRGFRLRLTGRIARAPGAGPIICRALGGQGRSPTCLIAVSLDEAAVENSATSETLSVWTMSRGSDDGVITERKVLSAADRGR